MSGRRRPGQRYSAEDQALSNINKEAESRLQAVKNDRAIARSYRMKEIEKQQRDMDDEHGAESTRSSSYRSTLPVLPPSSSTRTRYTAGFGSRKGSGDASADVDKDIREETEKTSETGRVSVFLMAEKVDFIEKLNEAQDKLKQAMLNNAQLDNEKACLKFELENLKDDTEETDEKHISLVKEHRKKCTEHELLKRDFEKLQRDLEGAKYQLDIRDKLIAEHNLVLVGEEKPEDEEEDESISSTGSGNGTPKPKQKPALITKEAADILKDAGEGTLDAKLKKLSDEKQELMDQLHRLKLDFEEEKARNVGRDVIGRGLQLNGPDSNIVAAAQKEAAQKVNEYKLKLQKAEQDNSTLQATINRLEGQVKRFKTASEKAEAAEEELKAEKRKLQRELRDAQVKTEELQNSYNHLQKRLDKLKQSKLAVISGGGKEDN